jgi:hypothetical protein
VRVIGVSDPEIPEPKRGKGRPRKVTPDLESQEGEAPAPISLSPLDEEILPESEPERAEKDYRTLAHGELSPRHRRLAFLAAQGNSNSAIGKELGYSDSRVSILLKNPYISAEIQKMQERIYEETIGQRMKGFADASLNVIQQVLNDRTNRVKMSEKIQVAQWVIEKLDGKAIQKIEAGENLLASLMDRLDAAKTRPVVQITNNFNGAVGPETFDVTPPAQKQLDAPKTEEDQLDDWLKDWEV